MSITTGASNEHVSHVEGGHEEPAPAAERLAEHVHRTVDHAAASAAEAEREVRRAASDATERLRSSEAELAEMLDQNLDKVRTYIEKNPLQSAGIAFVAGIVLSSLLRR